MKIFHWLNCSWTEWSNPEEVFLRKYNIDGSLGSRIEAYIQKRTCKICNKRQIRKIDFIEKR